MNILYITQILPYPLDTGGNIKSFQTISILKKLGHKVSIFSFVKDEKRLKYENRLINLKFIIGKTLLNPLLTEDYKKSRNLTKLLNSFLNLFSSKPFSVEKFSNCAMRSTIYDHIKKEKVDCIWVGYLSMSQYLPNNFSGMKILELPDINSIFFKQMFLKDSFLHWKIFAFFEWIKFYFYEKKQLPKFDKIFTMSLTDKKHIERTVGENNTSVLHPSVTPKKIPNKIKNNINTLLFIGNLCWYPNKDGIYWFLRKIYPGIKKSVPNIKVKIVGQLPRRDIFPRYEEVIFYGYQKNLEPFLGESSIFIVPIRYGSGLRLKILEAMSWNIPIISTTEGVDGLNVTNGKELLVAKNEKEFVEKVLRLLKDKKLRTRLILKASHFISSNYTKKKVIISLKSKLLPYVQFNPNI